MTSFSVLALILVAVILVLIIGIENPRRLWAAGALIRE
jgi:hypothetical protein